MTKAVPWFTAGTGRLAGEVRSAGGSGFRAGNVTFVNIHEAGLVISTLGPLSNVILILFLQSYGPHESARSCTGMPRFFLRPSFKPTSTFLVSHFFCSRSFFFYPFVGSRVFDAGTIGHVPLFNPPMHFFLALLLMCLLFHRI